MDPAREVNQRWARMLADWTIPDRVIASAPESPYFFDPPVFKAVADDALARTQDTPSDAVARQALPSAGSVLDVGVGAGAASLRLDPGHIVGVDPSGELLAAFAERAAQRDVGVTLLEGSWPDVASQAAVVDVAVCHHVVYNVRDLAAFANAMSSHARQRVVVEATTIHPMAWMTAYWQALYGLNQPDEPNIENAIEVLEALGLRLHQHRWQRPYQMIGETGPDQLARVARRLCLPPSRYDELRQILAATPPPQERQVTTIWWDTDSKTLS
jgi:SAM-dependent methyltransferase